MTTTAVAPAHDTEERRDAPTRRGTPAWLGLIGYLMVVAEVAAFSVLAPHFFTLDNLATVLSQAAVYAIAAFGLTLVVIVGGDDVIRGGIDLSVGAVLGFTGAVVAVLLRDGLPLAIAVLVGLAAAAAIGLVNGLVVSAGVRPLLATLSMMAIVMSLTIALTDNVKVAITDPGITWLRDGRPLGIPASVLVLFLVYIALVFVMTRTPFGTRASAVGQSPTAAQIAGIRVRPYVVASYVLAGVLAGVAGILMSGRLSAALPGIGEQSLIDILLATFMSVAFSRRLVVTITGTLFSAVFVAVLTNGFTQLGVQSQWIGLAKGILILLVLAIAAIRERSVRR